MELVFAGAAVTMFAIVLTRAESRATPFLLATLIAFALICLVLEVLRRMAYRIGTLPKRS